MVSNAGYSWDPLIILSGYPRVFSIVKKGLLKEYGHFLEKPQTKFPNNNNSTMKI